MPAAAVRQNPFLFHLKLSDQNNFIEKYNFYLTLLLSNTKVRP